MKKIKDWKGILFVLACAVAMFFAKVSYDYLAPAEPPPSLISSADFTKALSKPEPQGFSSPQRTIAKEKLLPLLQTGTKVNVLWTVCKGKNCVPSLKEILLLKTKAENVATFENQVCMVSVIEPRKKHWVIAPVYEYNEEKDACVLKNESDIGIVTNRQVLIAVILASAILLGVALIGWGLFTLTKEDEDSE